MDKNNTIEIVIEDSIKHNTTTLIGKLLDICYELGIEDYINVDVSSLSDEEMLILKDAVNPSINYLDIEMFLSSQISYPIFGGDFNYKIEERKLMGESYRKEK